MLIAIRPMLCLAFLLCACAAAQAERRVALVIGNGAYENAVPLPNPKNDAEDVAAALKRTGFETIVGLDLDQSEMQSATIRFARAAREADVALFYYSGHAMQYSGINYLVPVDARLRDDTDLRRLTRVDEIVADLQLAKGLRVLVLNSCRDNPLAEELKRSMSRTRNVSIQRGLARVDSPEGMIVAFSTQAGRTADDGTGRNSPYTAAFLKHIEEREEIGRVFRRVSADVFASTDKRQLPELSLSLIGEFYLRGKPDAAASGTDAAVPASPAAQVWENVKNTTDKKLLDAFLTEFPEGLYAALAQARLKELSEDKVAIGIFPGKPGSASAVKAGEEFKDCESCPTMVVLPSGAFVMGAAPGEAGKQTNETPQRSVAIKLPLAVSKFEITFDDWEPCVLEGGCNAHRPKDGGFGRGRRPVINVSWDDAKAYVAWLQAKTGKAYRLLTEAEWEYAARGGTTTAYATGTSITTEQANFDGSASPGARKASAYRGKTVEVGSFTPNPFGLHDMHGNVWEWVEDCWNPTHAGAPGDGSARGGDCKRRVLKGGAWYYEAALVRSATRSSYPKGTRLNIAGFRVARALD